MSLRLFSIKKAKTPKIAFGGDAVSDSVVNGLEQFGPWDLGKRLFNSLRLIIVYPEGQESIMYDLLENMIIEISLLRLRLEVILKISYNPGSASSYEETINKIREFIRNEPFRKDIAILQLIPEREEKPDSFYNLIKREIYLGSETNELSVQALMIPKWVEARDKIDYSRNLLLSIYSKMGGIPWVLKNTASRLIESASFIGYTTMEKKDVLYVIYSIFGSRGELIVNKILKYEAASDEDKKMYLEKAFKEMLENAYSSKLIALHRLGEINEIEKDILSNIINNIRGYLFIVEFPMDWSIPILIKSNYTHRNADPGTWFYGGVINNVPYFFIKLKSFNRRPSIVREAIKYGVILVTPRILDEFSWSDIADDIANQIYSLSSLHWGNVNGYFDVPVTIHFMRKMRNFVERNMVIPESNRAIFI